MAKVWGALGVLTALFVAQTALGNGGPATGPDTAVAPPRHVIVPADFDTPPTVMLGIVVALQQDTGVLVLRHGDGSRSQLHAPARLLDNVKVGDPVQAVVEGTTVQTLGPLGAPVLATLS